MSLQVEKLEKNMAKMTVEVPAEQFEEQSRLLTIKTKISSTSQVSEKGKLPWP